MLTGYKYLDLQLLEYLSPNDIYNLSLVNKYFRDITHEKVKLRKKFNELLQAEILKFNETSRTEIPKIKKYSSIEEMKLNIACRCNNIWLTLFYSQNINNDEIIGECLKTCYFNGFFELAEILIKIRHAKDNINYHFGNLCKYGKFDDAKIFYNKNILTIDIHANDEYAFGWACQNGHFNIVKWLFDFGNIKLSINCYQAYNGACLNGHLDIIKWLIEKEPLCVISSKALELACSNNQEHVIKMLLDLKDNVCCSSTVINHLIAKNDYGLLKKIWIYHNKIGVHQYYAENLFDKICAKCTNVNFFEYVIENRYYGCSIQYAFIKTCEAGNALCAGFLCSKYDFKINIDKMLNKSYFGKNEKILKIIFEFFPENYSKCLKCACRRNTIDIVQTILNINHDFDIKNILTRGYKCYSKDILKIIFEKKNITLSIKDFQDACATGNVQLANWIYTNNKSLDITQHDHLAFKLACDNKQYKTVEYLCSLNTNYNFEYVPIIKIDL